MRNMFIDTLKARPETNESEVCDLCGYQGSPLEGWHEHPTAIPSKIICNNCHEDLCDKCPECGDKVPKNKQFCGEFCEDRYHKGSYHY
jgi:hypothetical protein